MKQIEATHPDYIGTTRTTKVKEVIFSYKFKLFVNMNKKERNIGTNISNINGTQQKCKMSTLISFKGNKFTIHHTKT